LEFGRPDSTPGRLTIVATDDILDVIAEGVIQELGLVRLVDDQPETLVVA
jgi:hypothetical protein